MNNLFKFNSFLRFLSKNKAYTAIDIFGLSVSLMFVILIVTYTIQELSTDRFHQNSERIYMLGNEEFLMSSFGLGEKIKERYPEIEDVSTVTGAILLTGTNNMPVTSESNMFNAQVQFVNENFFRFFSFELVNGNKDQVLAARNDAVISQTFAHKLFPGEDPMGKVIQLNDSVNVTVNGIMKDISNSVIFYSDLLVRNENLRYFRGDMDGNTYNNALSANVFVLEREGSSLASKADDVRDYFKGLYWFYEREVVKEVVFIPLREAYFSDYDGYMTNKGDKKLVNILLSVGILILIFAIINYINLTVAQTGFRAKEMATRQLLGSSRMNLFSRLMMESTLLTFISFIFGLLLAFLFLPFANKLLETKIDLAGAFTGTNILITILVVLAIGSFSGLLPAILISRTKAVDVVKGTFRQKTKMVFSKFFITFQNAITIALIAAAIIMVTQVNHLINAPLGYNTTNIIDISVMDLSDNKLAKTIASELEQLSSVKQVSLCEGTPFNRGNNNTIDFEGRSISFQTLGGDSAFISMLGIEIIRENNVTADNAYYLNQYALKEENLPEDAVTFTYYQPNVPIAGIIKDFQLNNILHGQQPVLFRFKKRENIYAWNILVEVQGDPYKGYQEVKDVYERITRLEFPGQFVDKQVEESFSNMRRTTQIVSLFSAIAIILSLLGLLAMSTYFIQQRSREIGVRKVFGSTNKEILTRLVGTFLNYVLVAFVIATPIIWYIMKDWLSAYSYRISLSVVFFIISGLFCLIISFITVFWQSYKAANANPVTSIKAD